MRVRVCVSGNERIFICLRAREGVCVYVRECMYVCVCMCVCWYLCVRRHRRFFRSVAGKNEEKGEGEKERFFKFQSGNLNAVTLVLTSTPPSPGL